MAQTRYKIWSTYPPTLWNTGRGFLQIKAGTIEKLQVGSTPIPINTRLPEWTELSQFEWQKPAIKPFVPMVKKVQGSKGAVYIVKTTPYGKIICDCPGFHYRKHCRHVESFK
jgi:hypothetical protein